MIFRLALIAVMLFSCSAMAAPLGHHSQASLQNPSITRVDIMGEEDRKVVSDRRTIQDNPSRKVFCDKWIDSAGTGHGDQSSTGNIVFSQSVAISAAHPFVDANCQIRTKIFEACELFDQTDKDFKIIHMQGQTAISGVSKFQSGECDFERIYKLNPQEWTVRDKEVVASDWIVVRLERPAKFSRPYGIAATRTEGSYVLLSGQAGNFYGNMKGKVRPLVIETCESADQSGYPCLDSMDLRLLVHWFDTGKGTSGAAITVNRKIIGIHVGTVPGSNIAVAITPEIIDAVHRLARRKK